MEWSSVRGPWNAPQIWIVRHTDKLEVLLIVLFLLSWASWMQFIYIGKADQRPSTASSVNKVGTLQGQCPGSFSKEQQGSCPSSAGPRNLEQVYGNIAPVSTRQLLSISEGCLVATTFLVHQWSLGLTRFGAKLPPLKQDSETVSLFLPNEQCITSYGDWLKLIEILLGALEMDPSSISSPTCPLSGGMAWHPEGCTSSPSTVMENIN